MMRFRNSWLLRVIFWAVVSSMLPALSVCACTEIEDGGRRVTRVKVKFISEIPPITGTRVHTAL